MDSKEYVLNHDFGYGREPELDELKKLELRNIEDLIVYVDELYTCTTRNFNKIIAIKGTIITGSVSICV